ncbi:DNA-3-methyladenine glycosylase [Amycolatopsis sp. FDAARGOS 1241]|uniref:DNA-3-methyladenine glycosylase family protein n=1 Tax=Amycolatopsis sp. FDAARGOS 1241 TaxID=2778070 RepID=UPI00194F62C1|nr:DNA-3-methyladenine glycosylase 2 family protein [Amycolatopsis sp. FDAARGOS 1241]QRP48632.1 DNA-3-methyladenine glycosylase 2 family protein [Amycolatopsis sp. FDAARGOS 1241]
MEMPPDRSLHWQPGFPVDAKLTLKSLRRGRHDPTHRQEADGTLWRTALTSSGPVTYRIRQRRLDDLDVDAWGPGTDELIGSIRTELGEHDRPEDFRPAHPVLERAWSRLPGLRVPRTGRLFEALVPAILEQRVVGLDAQAAWARLVGAHGGPAPGPAPGTMRVMPSPAAWAKIPIWDWRRAGVDLHRSKTVSSAAWHAAKLDRAAADPARAYELMSAMSGVGVWTAAQVGHRALGDADALPLGDFNLGRMTGMALLGRPLAEQEIEAFYLPWRPHRYRVVRILELTPRSAPRRRHRAPRARPFQ